MLSVKYIYYVKSNLKKRNNRKLLIALVIELFIELLIATVNA